MPKHCRRRLQVITRNPAIMGYYSFTNREVRLGLSKVDVKEGFELMDESI